MRERHFEKTVAVSIGAHTSVQQAFAEVVNDSVLADNEGHDSRFPVLRRVSQDDETAGHFAVHDEVLRASRRLISLSCEYKYQVETLGTSASITTLV
jgi:hypothetical protein